MDRQERSTQLTYLSQQIQLDPTDLASIRHRSKLFASEGMINQAISDCTKIVHLEGSREDYASRSQMFLSKEMYIEALSDLQTAKGLEKQVCEQQTAVDIYLQNSVCMQHVQEVKELAQALLTENSTEKAMQFKSALSRLLEVKIMEQEQTIAQLKKHYEQQRKYFENLLKEFRSYPTYLDYQQIFLNQLQNKKISPIEQKKLQLYFTAFASEMEKYYVAAKNLHKIEDKTIKIQDFEAIIEANNPKDYLRKIYKIFDKYSSQVNKLEEIIKEIPYIGTAFKIIKTSMKAKGWIEESKLEHQCENIERVAVNITVFNQISLSLGLLMVQQYQEKILGKEQIPKSQWDELLSKIKKVKEDRIGIKHLKHELSDQEQKAKDYGIIHGSIVMVALACNRVHLNRQILGEVNKLWKQGGKQSCLSQFKKAFDVIDTIEQTLKRPKEGEEKTKQEGKSSSYCVIY